jgi:hypothetical protein
MAATGFALACVFAASLATAAQAADMTQVGPLASADSLLAAGPRAEPGLELTYAVKGGERPGTLILDLAPDFAIVTQDSERTIYDYPLRRIVKLDDKTHSFVNISLYAMVDFFVMETFNRRMQRKLLADVKANGLAADMDAFWVQSELHVMDAGDGTPKIDRTVDPGGSVHFRYNGAEVASYSPSSHALTADEGARLKKLLRFTTTLHPSIIDDIAASGYVPQHLSFATPPMRKKPSADWTLQSAAAVKAVIPLRSGDRPVPPALPEPAASLAPVMSAALAGQAPGKRSVEDYRRAIEKVVAQNPFQAAVLSFEATLQYGEHAADCADEGRCHPLKQVFEMAQRDPRTAMLLQALQPPKNEAEAMTAAKALEAVRRDDLTDVFVIDEFRANLLGEAGHADEALPLLAVAIKGNPYLAGYYKDMGDVFRRTFQPDAAWFFYDLGRELPDGEDAPVISRFNDYEARLAQMHPEFF